MAAAEAISLRPTVARAEGRTPPHDIDAEAAVLSAVLLDPSALDNVEDILRAEHFYSESHARIYDACVDVYEARGGLDVVLVGTHLRDTGRLAQIGGMAYLTEVIGAAPAVGNVRRYAQVVVDKWRVRQAIQICQKHAAVGYSEYGETDGYVQALAEDVHALACSNVPSTTKTLRELVAGTIETALIASKSGRMISGLETGLDRYDRMTAGLHDGELTIIAARTGMGKTSLALNMGEFVAATSLPDASQPYAVQVFSLEMPREQLVGRLLCSASSVDVARLRTGMLSPTDWQKLSSGATRLAPLDIVIDDAASMSIVEVRSKSRRAQAEAKKRGRKLALIIVDYLQLMRGSRNTTSREQEVAEVSRGLKQLAKEISVPVIALAQINRRNEERADKRPQLSDLRESGSIEQDADNIVFIYREDYYKHDSTERGVAELIVAKQRNGPTDTVKVKFDAQYTRFDNLPDGYGDDDRHGD